jgi:quercetin dioxygenase-like cupin family protein
MKVHHVSPEAAVDADTEYFVGEVRVQPIVSPDQRIDMIVVHCIEGTGIPATETERNVVKPGDIVHVPRAMPGLPPVRI